MINPQINLCVFRTKVQESLSAPSKSSYPHLHCELALRRSHAHVVERTNGVLALVLWKLA